MTAIPLATLTTAFLRSTRPLQLFGALLCAEAGGGLLLTLGQGEVLAGGLFAAALAGGLPLAWFALRVNFDAAAFALIAAQPDEGAGLREFDTALRRLGLRQGGDARDLAQRAAATRGLVWRLAAVVCGQLFLVLAATACLYAAMV